MVTHNGVFHADDVFAVATLQLAYGVENVYVTRTRDAKVIESADVVVDVGAQYDRMRKRFDHHQKERAGARPSGILYSSFGLVWAEYGAALCSSEVAEIVDRSLVAPVDATDNGQALFTGGQPAFPGVMGCSVSRVISGFNPCWNEQDRDFDAAFILKAVPFAREILGREIYSARAQIYAREIVRSARGGPIVVLNCFCPWQETIQEPGGEDARYVVFPSETGTWMVQAVNTKPGSFELRRPLPEAWAGLRDEEFQKATGISDGIFCHPGRFICGAGSRESAMKLAQMALSD